jgi:hypothetical protein
MFVHQATIMAHKDSETAQSYYESQHFMEPSGFEIGLVLQLLNLFRGCACSAG